MTQYAHHTLIKGQIQMHEYAVIGNPIEHSLSPNLHRAFAKSLGETIHYETLPSGIGQFSQVARHFFSTGGMGLNVTLPFKEEAVGFVNDCTQRARLAGAVNVIKRFPGGRLLGDNVDGQGLLNDLLKNHGISLHGKRILILGAGGAVRGMLPALMTEHPAAISLLNRTYSKAQQLADQHEGVAAIKHAQLLPHDIIFNGTSQGLTGEMPILDNSIFEQAAVCYDLVYQKADTPFVAHAKKLGVPTALDGLGMLVEQGALSYHFWRGVLPATKGIVSLLRQ